MTCSMQRDLGHILFQGCHLHDLHLELCWLACCHSLVAMPVWLWLDSSFMRARKCQALSLFFNTLVWS